MLPSGFIDKFVQVARSPDPQETIAALLDEWHSG
jgi:hypothetical protein